MQEHGSLVSRLDSRVSRLLSLVSGTIGALVLAYGLIWQQGILDKTYQLLLPADVAAMAWISRELPPDAAFYVNCAPAFGTLYTGTDGGWWLSFLTGRRSSLPPITYGSEAAADPAYIADVNNTITRIRKQSLATPEAVAALRAAGIAYLYNGPAATPNDEQISAEQLASSPYYELLYESDGVTIWKVR